MKTVGFLTNWLSFWFGYPHEHTRFDPLGSRTNLSAVWKWYWSGFLGNDQLPERQGLLTIFRYYLSFKNRCDSAYEFWQGVQDFTNVQDVIDNYETKVGQRISWMQVFTIRRFDTIHEDTTGCSIRTFLNTILQRFSIIRLLSSKSKPLQTMKELCLYFRRVGACIELPIRLDSQPHVYDWSSGLSLSSVS